MDLSSDTVMTSTPALASKPEPGRHARALSKIGKRTRASTSRVPAIARARVTLPKLPPKKLSALPAKRTLSHTTLAVTGTIVARQSRYIDALHAELDRIHPCGSQRPPVAPDLQPEDALSSFVDALAHARERQQDANSQIEQLRALYSSARRERRHEARRHDDEIKTARSRIADVESELERVRLALSGTDQWAQSPVPSEGVGDGAAVMHSGAAFRRLQSALAAAVRDARLAAAARDLAESLATEHEMRAERESLRHQDQMSLYTRENSRLLRTKEALEAQVFELEGGDLGHVPEDPIHALFRQLRDKRKKPSPGDTSTAAADTSVEVVGPSPPSGALGGPLVTLADVGGAEDYSASAAERPREPTPASSAVVSQTLAAQDYVPESPASARHPQSDTLDVDRSLYEESQEVTSAGDGEVARLFRSSCEDHYRRCREFVRALGGPDLFELALRDMRVTLSNLAPGADPTLFMTLVTEQCVDHVSDVMMLMKEVSEQATSIQKLMQDVDAVEAVNVRNATKMSVDAEHRTLMAERLLQANIFLRRLKRGRASVDDIPANGCMEPHSVVPTLLRATLGPSLVRRRDEQGDEDSDAVSDGSGQGQSGLSGDASALRPEGPPLSQPALDCFRRAHKRRALWNALRT